MIWSLQNFHKKYKMLSHLKDIFLTTSIVLLSAMVILNMFKYIWVLLKLYLLLRIYRQFFDCLNLIYIMSLIHKNRFKDLNFFILGRGAIDKMLKAIIFINKIDNAIWIAKYLQLKLLKQIENERYLEYIIYKFLANFITTLSFKWLVSH